MKRECGTCSLCCVVAEVPELNKPGEVPCTYIVDSEAGSCGIFDSAGRPAICKAFGCGWLRGFGEEDDRPDKLNVMFSINLTAPGKVVGFMWLKDGIDAAVPRAWELAIEFAHEQKMPLITVVDPTDPGEYVIVSDDIAAKAAAILGDEVRRLSEDVAMYKRVEPDGIHRSD